MTLSAGKKILMLVENNPFPADLRVRQEAVALVEAGYQVSVIAQRDEGEPLFEKVDGAFAYRYPAPREADSLLGYMWEYGYSLVAAFILSWVAYFHRGFKVIHAHNPPDIYVFIAIIFKPLGVKFIFDHHDLSPENYNARFRQGGNPLVYKVLLWLERLTCQVADHVISTNESYKRIAMERNGVAEENVTVVRNGPNLERLRLVEPDRRLREKGKTIVGYVGIMGPQDGLDYLLRALRHLVYDLKRQDFYTVIIGTGSEWERLKELSTQLGLDEYVWFTGRITDDELCSYLSTADICVSADPYNQFNDHCTMIKMVEYMTFGKPIVAFDLTEHRYTAQSAAIYIPDNDELLYAKALAELMDDPERRQMMGQFGRKRIETELDWKYSLQNLLSVYDKLYSRKQPEVSVVHE